jgi:hypothetical protein
MTAATITTRQYAALLRVDPETLYDAVARGKTDITPIRVGRVLRWPLRPILDLLGLDELPADVAAS